MKKFKFRLQRLLEIRETRENEVKNELAKLIAVQNVERVKQNTLRNSMDQQRSAYSEKFRAGRSTAQETIIYEKFVDMSLRAIEAAEQRILKMEPEVNKVRQKLMEASRERKVVERLKERKKEEYMYEVNKELAKENDDINQNIFNRNKLSYSGGMT